MLCANENGKSKLFLCYFLSCKEEASVLQYADSELEAAENAIKDYFVKSVKNLEREGLTAVDIDVPNISMSNYICVVDIGKIQITEKSANESVFFFESSKVAQDAGFHEEASLMLESWKGNA